MFSAKAVREQTLQNIENFKSEKRKSKIEEVHNAILNASFHRNFSANVMVESELLEFIVDHFSDFDVSWIKYKGIDAFEVFFNWKKVD